jgi:hypothetical protein
MGWQLSFWLIAGGLYALVNGFGNWDRWEDLAFWTRFHASINVSTGISMLLGAIGIMVVHARLRWIVLISAAAAAVLGTSLIGGALLGTIPCDGPT